MASPPHFHISLFVALFQQDPGRRDWVTSCTDAPIVGHPFEGNSHEGDWIALGVLPACDGAGGFRFVLYAAGLLVAMDDATAFR